jgi:hypothetical protein
MLDDYGTPERFWAEAINTAYHATNWVYLHRLLEKTPYELLVGRKPNISYFWLFGCKCFIYKKKNLANLNVDVMRLSFLVMHQTPKHIEYSIKSLGKLKKHVMQSLMNLMAPKGKLLVMIM